MQVNITWEDVLQEEHNKGIFDMELEDLDEDKDNLGYEGTKVCPLFWNSFDNKFASTLLFS
jgi:hypothetical protein